MIHLVNGDVELDLDPNAGMSTTSMRWRGHELLAPSRARREEIVRVDTVRGMALLAPWANRLPGDRYEAEGRSVDLAGLPIERDADGLPLHGTITGRGAWVVLDQRADMVVAAIQLDGDPVTAKAFPFAARLQVVWRLTGASLEVTTTLFATDRGLVPACFGWHPYIVLPDADREACTVRLPGGAPEPVGPETVDTLVVLGEDRSATVTGARRSITIALGPGYDALQVWMPAGEPFVSLEPMAARTGALADGSYASARPGAPHRATFSLAVLGTD